MESKVHARLRRIAERLKRDYHAEKVILFGSYAEGEMTEDSDVDILVIAPTKERLFERMASVRRLIRHLRDGVPVASLVLTPEEIRERQRVGDQFITEILRKGVAL